MGFEFSKTPENRQWGDSFRKCLSRAVSGDSAAASMRFASARIDSTSLATVPLASSTGVCWSAPAEHPANWTSTALRVSASPEIHLPRSPIARLIFQLKMVQVDVRAEGRTPNKTLEAQLQNQFQRQLEKAVGSPSGERFEVSSQDFL